METLNKIPLELMNQVAKIILSAAKNMDLIKMNNDLNNLDLKYTSNLPIILLSNFKNSNLFKEEKFNNSEKLILTSGNITYIVTYII